MKIRNSFVSNSSSTSFLIINRSDVVRTLVDFVDENYQTIMYISKEWELWGLDECTKSSLLLSAKQNNIEWYQFQNQ